MCAIENSEVKKKEMGGALTGVAQWVGHCPLNQKGAGSWSGHVPGLWARSPVGGVFEAAN